LSFQWRKGLTELSGAIQSTLHLTDVTLDDTGDYSVAVSNEFGTVTSDTVRVAVVIRPTRLFVSAESPNPTAPFTNWTTAAREIQEAVDIAALGAEILVGDGIYSTGGRAVEGTVTNRVAVGRAVQLRSVNGPEFTLIQGAPASGGGTGEGAVRCVYLAEGASLTGFTLTNGFAQGDGGGAWCASANGFLTNCVLTANVGSSGGGVYRGTLFHCTLTGNSATKAGGGVYEGRMVNSIVQLNQAPIRANWTHGDAGSISFAYSCTSPLPTNGVGNLDADPLFVDAANGDFRLGPGSPCIDAGDPFSTLTSDILAVPRPLDGDGDGIARVDMGAYELNPYHFEAAMAVNAQGMQFTVRGEPGKTVRIDRSSDLLIWEPVATVPLPASGQTLIDPAAVGEQRLFYRLVKP
jgi:hypothetical protein